MTTVIYKNDNRNHSIVLITIVPGIIQTDNIGLTDIIVLYILCNYLKTKIYYENG